MENLLAGTHVGNHPVLSALPKDQPLDKPKKEEPWIGPDGGVIGRGIKSMGDMYMDYVQSQKPQLMRDMRAKLTPSPMAVDALEAWGQGTLTMHTGIDTGYKPKYAVNVLFTPHRWYNTGKGAPPVMGFQQRANPLVPLLTAGARVAGGDTIKASEQANYAQAATLSLLGAKASPANQSMQETLDVTGKVLDAAKKKDNPL